MSEGACHSVKERRLATFQQASDFGELELLLLGPSWEGLEGLCFAWARAPLCKGGRSLELREERGRVTRVKQNLLPMGWKSVAMGLEDREHLTVIIEVLREEFANRLIGYDVRRPAQLAVSFVRACTIRVREATETMNALPQSPVCECDLSAKCLMCFLAGG